jgi:hypothetical protein
VLITGVGSVEDELSSELHIEATLSIKRQNNPGIKISFFIMFDI